MTGAVLVTGPAQGGVSSLVAALRHKLAGFEVTERATAPAVVVFAVSAVAPVTESDCALLRAVAGRAGVVVGVVTKIDTHQRWRDVLRADRAIVGARFADLPWVGVAAAPQEGEPRVDELVELLARCPVGGAPVRRPPADPRGPRRAAAVRGRLARSRVALTYLARNRCAALRAELHEEVAELGRRRVDRFADHVRRRTAEVAAGVEAEVTTRLVGVATELRLSAPVAGPAALPAVAVGGPVLPSRRLETRLVTLLAAGFGLGVALAVSRLFSALDPGLSTAGLVAGGLVGVAVTVWVVGIRGLLHDRAVIDRWVVQACATLRSALEETVAARVLDAESVWTVEVVAGRRDPGCGASVSLPTTNGRLPASNAGKAVH